MENSPSESGLSEIELKLLKVQDMAAALAQGCAELERSRGDEAAYDLRSILNYLMTELWDRGFSSTEIVMALRQAAADVSRYSGGSERNGTGLR